MTIVPQLLLFASLISLSKGWSFGGVVAFEAAHVLMARGFEVKGLVLIDSPSPVNHEPLPAAVIAGMTGAGAQSNRSPYGGADAVREEFASNGSLLGSYKLDSRLQSTARSLKTVMLRSQELLDTKTLWDVEYDWLSRQDTRTASIAVWKSLVGGHVEVLPIPGNHFEPFLPGNVCITTYASFQFHVVTRAIYMLTHMMQIEETASQLWRACRYIEES